MYRVGLAILERCSLPQQAHVGLQMIFFQIEAGPPRGGNGLDQKRESPQLLSLLLSCDDIGLDFLVPGLAHLGQREM